MNVIKALARVIPTSNTQIPALQRGGIFPINNQVSLYPYDKSETYIGKGYNKNAWVYAIVSKCAKKFGQIPWYHYRIKRTEVKTWNEYGLLTKNGFSDDVKLRLELRKMRTKAVEQVRQDSKLQEILDRPNRNQTGAILREQLYGYKLLSGEGNIWLSKLEKAVQEMFIIPKANLALVKGADSLADVSSYKLLLGGQELPAEKDSIIMWRFPNYEFDPISLGHLRGQSPLDAGLLLLQSDNEGQERLINMNKNQGVAGLSFRKDQHQTPSVEQALFQRHNSILSLMTGNWRDPLP
jgi:hypothetical protein